MIHNVKIIIISALLAFSGANPLLCQQTLTLKQCLELAVNSNYSIRNAGLDINEAKAKTKEARASALPQATASASLTDNLAIPVMMLPGEIVGQPGEMIPAELGVPYEADVSLQLNQVIFNPALFTGIKAARSAEELAELKRQMTKEQLIYDVASVYFDILHSEQQLKSIADNLDLQDSIYAKTALRVKDELAREIDLNRIKVNISSLKVKKEHLQSAVRQQKRYLQVLAGILLDEDFSTDNSILTAIDFPIRNLYGENTLFQKTELAALKQQKQLNELELKATRMQYLPSLSFVASGSYQFQSEQFQLDNKESWFKSAFIGLRLNIPIFDGSAKRHTIKQIKLRDMKLDNDIHHTEQALRMERENALSELIVSYKSTQLQEENLRLAEKTCEQSRMLYKEGLYTVTDLLQTEHSLREAQTAHISEIIQYKKAELNLMKAEGKLVENYEL
jgi:outer membrane protein TolC